MAGARRGLAVFACEKIGNGSGGERIRIHGVWSSRESRNLGKGLFSETRPVAVDTGLRANFNRR
jgi:hypothetical protein